MSAKWSYALRWMILAALALSFSLGYVKLQLSPVRIRSSGLILSEVTSKFAHLQRGWPATFERTDELSGNSKQSFGLLFLDGMIGLVLLASLMLFIKRWLWRAHAWRISLRSF